MPSNPFPGMNPFLQKSWSDVHTTLIGLIRQALSEELPTDLTVRAEERVAAAGGEKTYRPDIAVVEPWRGGFPPVWSPGDPSTRALILAEPIIVLSEPETERWLEIRDARGRVITVIEVLSPSNKSDQGWQDYRQKQRDFLAAGVSLVEIDLLRGGQHVLAVSRDSFTMPPGSGYLVCVVRQQPGFANRREIYPCASREPLPTIRVPLRVGDPDVPLALQPLIDSCYLSGRYWLEDHGRELQPPLSAEETGWVDERLRTAGLK